MDKILLMDFELNNPLTYLNKFKKLINDENWILDLFWARDYQKKNKPSVDSKINDARFLIIHKPLTFLTSPKIREKLQEIAIKEKKNFLIMYTFSERDSMDALNKFLNPFMINTSEVQIIDNKVNQDNIRNVIFQKQNKCFSHKVLFKGVNKILIPNPHHIYVDEPAKVLIRGNPSTEVKYDFFVETTNLKGRDLIAGAYYEDTARLIVLDSTLFLDKFFDFNKKFIKNVIKWLA